MTPSPAKPVDEADELASLSRTFDVSARGDDDTGIGMNVLAAMAINPLSPPCISPNPCFRDLSARSKFLAVDKDFRFVFRAISGSTNAVALDDRGSRGVRRRCHSSTSYDISTRSG
jgi:hypothetical protein